MHAFPELLSYSADNRLYQVNMALDFDDSHIIYYHIEAQWSRVFAQTYFTNPDYLVVQCWIHSSFLSPDKINQTEPHVQWVTLLWASLQTHGSNPLCKSCTALSFNCLSGAIVYKFSNCNNVRCKFCSVHVLLCYNLLSQWISLYIQFNSASLYFCLVL